MTQLSEQMLDQVLRRDLAAVADNGFSARVMRALPQRRRSQPWLLALAALAGVLLAWLVLPMPQLQQATREWLTGNIQTSPAIVCALLLLGVGLLGCGWALEETA